MEAEDSGGGQGSGQGRTTGREGVHSGRDLTRFCVAMPAAGLYRSHMWSVGVKNPAIGVALLALARNDR